MKLLNSKDGNDKICVACNKGKNVNQFTKYINEQNSKQVQSTGISSSQNTGLLEDKEQNTQTLFNRLTTPPITEKEVNQCLEKGVDLIREKDGNTLLLQAIQMGQPTAIIELLIQKTNEALSKNQDSIGAINKENSNRVTPLQMAISCCNCKAIECLINNGADLNPETGDKPLLYVLNFFFKGSECESLLRDNEDKLVETIQTLVKKINVKRENLEKDHKDATSNNPFENQLEQAKKLWNDCNLKAYDLLNNNSDKSQYDTIDTILNFPHELT